MFMDQCKKKPPRLSSLCPAVCSEVEGRGGFDSENFDYFLLLGGCDIFVDYTVISHDMLVKSYLHALTKYAHLDCYWSCSLCLFRCFFSSDIKSGLVLIAIFDHRYLEMPEHGNFEVSTNSKVVKILYFLMISNGQPFSIRTQTHENFLKLNGNLELRIKFRKQKLNFFAISDVTFLFNFLQSPSKRNFSITQ